MRSITPTSAAASSSRTGAVAASIGAKSIRTRGLRRRSGGDDDEHVCRHHPKARRAGRAVVSPLAQHWPLFAGVRGQLRQLDHVAPARSGALAAVSGRSIGASGAIARSHDSSLPKRARGVEANAPRALAPALTSSPSLLLP